MLDMRLTGVGASKGLAVGPVFIQASKELEPERENISEGKVDEELARFRSAVEAVVRKLAATADAMHEGGSGKEAGIWVGYAGRRRGSRS